MKRRPQPKLFENVVTRQRYVCADPRDITVIDGVDYLTVAEAGSSRQHLMRRDALKRINTV